MLMCWLPSGHADKPCCGAATLSLLVALSGQTTLFAGVCWKVFSHWHANLARHSREGLCHHDHAALRDSSVKDMACRARINAPSKTKSLTFLMGCINLAWTHEQGHDDSIPRHSSVAQQAA